MNYGPSFPAGPAVLGGTSVALGWTTAGYVLLALAGVLAVGMTIARLRRDRA